MTRTLLTLLLAVPAITLAQDWDVSYDYVGVGYGWIDEEIADIEVDSDGYYLEASAGGKYMHMFAAYARGEAGNVLGSGFDIEMDQSLVGFGAHFNVQSGELLIQSAISVYIDLGYARATAELGPVSAVDEGVQLGIGVRVMPGPRSEWRVGISQYDGDLRGWLDGTSGSLSIETESTGIGVGGKFYMTEAAALQTSFARNLDTDANTVSIGVVFHFGQDQGD